MSGVRPLLRRIHEQASSWVDSVTNELIRSEGYDFGKEPQRHRKSRNTTPDEALKRLILSARSLEDIWQFLLQRLRNSANPLFVLFSVVDEVGELLRIRSIYPESPEMPFQGEFIPLCDKANHFVKTVLRSDTTFTNTLDELGQEVYPYLKQSALEKHPIFSVPLVAGNRTIAVITLGFEALDSFSQAQLSYVYLIRDHLAHVVWNLILQERLSHQPQVDNLTGLITYSSFQQAFQKEIRRARFEKFPLSLLLVDINDLKAYNQRYSHQMGDRAIARLASVIKHQVRGIDTVSRYGNDEIAVILPECDVEQARQVAEKIIRSVQEPHAAIKPYTVTLGLAGFPQDTADADDLLQLAENALQFGKHQSDACQQSTLMQACDLDNASDQERIDVFTTQIAKKYGETGSDLFETLLRRIEQNAQLETESMMLETVASLAGAMEAKDPYTRGHSQSVANYAVALSHAVGLSAGDIERVRLAAFFHDIGKIGIPESILNKPGPLTLAEKAIMDQHPVIGARQILQPVSALHDIVPLVEYHHERWDGQGHPVGLQGENIPIGARIVSIVDAFHALTSHRPYRAAMSLDEAVGILRDGAGTLWDPTLIDTFCGLLHKARCQQAA